ncbi:hypothetical protein PRZ48_006001 [Zasmidium cellare]|uniref:DUF7918 domain-containing protein n=1 Tax=Zasmidium cellare TaxID=395010 RepID=A0ABR0EN24_ZASCE|nr:hypothetical protein PRZ48_006001 [Zasmidium cellare]
MPSRRYLDVNIVDGITGKPLREWGKQPLPQGRGVSSFVQAVTGRPFKVRIEPTLPFIPIVAEQRENERQDRAMTGEHRHLDFAPWHLLCTLRLDGRFEKRAIAYLDPRHAHFKRIVVMDGRHVADGQGNRYWHRWVFKEAGSGIDLLLDSLSLAPSGKEGSQEEQLASLLEGLDPHEKQDTTMSGMLEITFERVTVKQSSYTEEWKPSMDAENEEGTDAKAEKDVSHKAATDKASSQKSAKMTTFIDYNLVNEEPYAVFQFKYRSEDVLRKYGFPGFPKKDTVKVPDELMATVSLEGTSKKRAAGSEQSDEQSDDEGMSRAKRATTESQRAGGDGREAMFARGEMRSGEDSDDEDMTTVKRAEMSETTRAEWTKAQALQQVEKNDDDKENAATTHTPTKETTKDGLRAHLNTVHLTASEAIRSGMNEDEKDDINNDNDDDEQKPDRASNVIKQNAEEAEDGDGEHKNEQKPNIKQDAGEAEGDDEVV